MCLKWIFVCVRREPSPQRATHSNLFRRLSVSKLSCVHNFGRSWCCTVGRRTFGSFTILIIYSRTWAFMTDLTHTAFGVGHANVGLELDNLRCVKCLRSIWHERSEAQGFLGSWLDIHASWNYGFIKFTWHLFRANVEEAKNERHSRKKSRKTWHLRNSNLT